MYFQKPINNNKKVFSYVKKYPIIAVVNINNGETFAICNCFFK